MTARLLPVLAGLLLGAAGLLGFGADAESHPWVELPPGQLLAERHDAFLEMEDGRHLAEIDARLERQAEGATLYVHVNAVGPGVEPAPGLEGVPGGNHTTAREINALLGEEGGLSAVAVLASGQRVQATIVPGYPVRLRARRVNEKGRIDFHAKTEPLVSSFTVVAPGLPEGTHRLDIEARGKVRLTGTFEVGPDGGRLDGFAATGGLHRRRVVN